MLPRRPIDSRGLPEGYPLDPDWEVTPRNVRDRLADPKAHGPILLVDCRTHEEIAIARIEGALHIPLAELPSRFNELDLEDNDDQNPTVVIHCHHGRRSLSAASLLKQAGINARSMAGGIELWSIDIDPTVPRY